MAEGYGEDAREMPSLLTVLEVRRERGGDMGDDKARAVSLSALIMSLSGRASPFWE